jgi:hypothetical protein
MLKKRLSFFFPTQQQPKAARSVVAFSHLACSTRDRWPACRQPCWEVGRERRVVVITPLADEPRDTHTLFFPASTDTLQSQSLVSPLHTYHRRHQPNAPARRARRARPRPHFGRSLDDGGHRWRGAGRGFAGGHGLPPEVGCGGRENESGVEKKTKVDAGKPPLFSFFRAGALSPPPRRAAETEKPWISGTRPTQTTAASARCE